MRFYLFSALLAFILPMNLLAQSTASNVDNIAGLWTGTLYNDSTATFSNHEIAITMEKGKLTGFSHTWFAVAGKPYYGVKKVAVKTAPDGKIIIVDLDLIADDYPDETKYIPQLNVLTLVETGVTASLSGPFVTNRTKGYQAVTGVVRLIKNNVPGQSALWPHLQQLGKEKDFSFIQVAMQ